MYQKVDKKTESKNTGYKKEIHNYKNHQHTFQT
jgi:hypothetical protein